MQSLFPNMDIVVRGGKAPSTPQTARYPVDAAGSNTSGPAQSEIDTPTMHGDALASGGQPPSDWEALVCSSDAMC